MTLPPQERLKLSVRAGDASELNPLADDVDNLVGELESLRQGLETLDSPTAVIDDPPPNRRAES